MKMPVLAILLLTVACSASPPELTARDGWTRETGGATSAAVYLTVSNGGGTGDQLVAVSSETGNAGLHRSDIVDGVARMVPVPENEGLAIPAGGELELSPGGAHVMLTGMRAPLREGERFDVTLRFRRSAPQRLEIAVREAGVVHAGH